VCEAAALSGSAAAWAALDGPALERHLARLDEKHRTRGW
jgi:hypothetical protein